MYDLMETKESKLEARKTEAALLIGRKKVTQLNIELSQKRIPTRKTMKYFGIEYQKENRESRKGRNCCEYNHDEHKIVTEQ